MEAMDTTSETVVLPLPKIWISGQGKSICHQIPAIHKTIRGHSHCSFRWSHPSPAPLVYVSPHSVSLFLYPFLPPFIMNLGMGSLRVEVDKHRMWRPRTTFCLRQGTLHIGQARWLANFQGSTWMCLPFSHCWNYKCLPPYLFHGFLEFEPKASVYKLSYLPVHLLPFSLPSPNSSCPLPTFLWSCAPF